MHKEQFIAELKKKLSSLPSRDVADRIAFYEEMIDDRIEEGLTEDEAVSSVGSIDEIASQIISDIPLLKIAKERMKPKRRLKAWEIVLLAVGSPIWASLAIATVAVIVSLYASLWAIVVSLWAAFASLVGGGIGGILTGIVFALVSYSPSGLAVIAAGLVCTGLSVFLFFGCKAATVGTARLAKIIVLSIKRCFVKKEVA